VSERARVVGGDLFKHFATAAAASADRAALVFLDPPYRFLREQPERLQRLAEQLRAHVSPEGVIVFRHDADDRLALDAFEEVDRRTYGGMDIEILRSRRIS
jgi:16S rRNA G966 N2-methylase RsmD